MKRQEKRTSVALPFGDRMTLSAAETRSLVEQMTYCACIYERDRRDDEAKVARAAANCLREGGTVEGTAW